MEQNNSIYVSMINIILGVDDMNKKGLIVAILAIALTFLIACKSTEVNDSIKDVQTNTDVQDVEIQDKHKTSEDELKEEAEKIFTVDNSENKIKILFDSKSKLQPSFYDVKWLNNTNFAYKCYSKDGMNNRYYEFNTLTKEIKQTFNLDGEYYWQTLVNDGQGLIYSNDGFNGLYYLSKNKESTKIMDSQRWYNISPDGRKIIINGSPTKDSTQEHFQRYIYDIESGALILNESIPDMDYVFSYLAARWSHDSIHISSQETDKSNSLKIIDTVNNKVKKEIIIDGAIISYPCWSTNGKELAFLVQSEQNSGYVLEGEDTNFYLSDRVGIYSTEDNSLKYIDLKDSLAVNPITWGIESSGFFIDTVPKSTADEILGRTHDSEINEKYAMNYVNVSTEKVKEIFKIKIDMYYNNILVTTVPLKMQDDGTLLYYESNELDGEISSVKAFNRDTGEIIEIFESKSYIQQIFEKDDKLVVISQDGIYDIDKDLKHETVFSFDTYNDEGLSYIYTSVSPDKERAIVGVEYIHGSPKESFFELIDLK